MTTEFETLASLPMPVRVDIKQYCRLRGCEYSEIFNAKKDSIWDMAKVNGLITFLARKSHKLRHIETASRQGRNYCLAVIEKSQNPDFKIRTTDWEKMKLCRR